MHVVIRAVKSFCRFYPLTATGSVLFSVGILLFLWIGLSESDLFALSIGGGFIFLAILCAIGTTTLVLLNRRKLSADLQLMTSGPISQSRADAGVVLQQTRLFPFFQLRVTPFISGPANEEVFSPFSQIFRGGEFERFAANSLTFPHRGLWHLSSLRISVEDRFGVSSVSWEIIPGKVFEVPCETIPLRPLPVVAASARSGDELTHSRERSGDLFDTKAYDPSDGVKRILWKTFARSGELIVRRPEPAVIPEGEVPLFLCAGRSDDVVAGALLGYLQQLERINVQVIFGTDGSPIGEVRSAETIQHSVTSTVWDPKAGTGEDFGRYLEKLDESRRFISQVIVFGPAREGEWLERIIRATATRQIQLAIAFVPEHLAVGRFGAPEKPKERADFVAALQHAERGGAMPLVCERIE